MTTHTHTDEYLSTFRVAQLTGMCPRSVTRICHQNAATLQKFNNGTPDMYRIPKREGSSGKFGGDVRVRYSAFVRLLTKTPLTDVTTGPSGEGCWDALVSAMQRPTRIIGPMDPVPPEVLKAALSLYGSEHRAA